MLGLGLGEPDGLGLGDTGGDGPPLGLGHGFGLKIAAMPAP